MTIITAIIAFLIALTIHEAAHAWMSDRLGDPTARTMGRLSLNPIAHLDPFGTVLFPLLLILLGSPVLFGWAKPVMFDPFNLKNPKRDSALISLAGPTANLIVAIIFAVLLGFTSNPFSPIHYLSNLFVMIVTINVVLGIFNLVPIHPLDGGKIFIGLLPDDQASEADLFLKRYGMLILFFLIFPTIHGTSPLFAVLSPVIDFILRILLPGTPLV